MHILHAREKPGALGGIDKIKVQLLHRIGRGEKALLHRLTGRAMGFEIVHIGVHAKVLRIIQKLRAIECLAIGEDDRETVEPLERADNLRRDICREVLRRNDPILRAVSHGGTAGRDSIAHGRKLRHIRHDLPVAAAGRHDDVIPARERSGDGGLRARCDLLIGIEQCAVHIDGDELICHEKFLSAQFHSVYCTRFAPACQPDGGT